MAYAISVDHDRRLVDVNYRGAVSIASRSAAHRDTRVLLADTGYRCILIDYTAARPQAEAFGDIEQFVGRIANDPVLRLCRIAFVGHRTQLFNTTVETLADARHYPFNRFFDRASAMAWLGEYR